MFALPQAIIWTNADSFSDHKKQTSMKSHSKYYIFKQGTDFKNVCKMVAILSQSQCI